MSRLAESDGYQQQPDLSISTRPNPNSNPDTNPNPNFNSNTNTNTMCMGTICQTCSKAHSIPRNGQRPSLTANTDKQAWFGCGNHVASVFANVPEDDWCTCEPKVEKDGKQYPPQAK